MRVTYNWLKDFVEIKISPQTLAHKLTMAGLEVVSLEKAKDDWILELEITSNRPDCLSVIGIAREVAAITNSKFKLPKTTNYKLQITKKSKEPPFIEIEDRRDCPLYTLRLIEDVKVDLSPEWLRQRLENVGIRCVNNVVDITNYILIETGQPLHAFDYDRLEKNSIFVRRAREGEKIITIDGIERELNGDTLVISDSKRAVAIAGIMGSKDTEVNKDTKNILLESAEFNPLIVRRARRNLGLLTESSYRFERGVDRFNVIFASQRAQELIKEIAGGNLRIFRIEGEPNGKKLVSLNMKSVERNLGIHIPKPQIKRILKSLSFEIKEEKNSFKVYIPPFRKDIKEEIDLIEEIARIYGYDKIPLTLPYIKVSTPKVCIQDKIRDIIRSTLLKVGLNEVITYSLIDPDFLKKDEVFVNILNPLSKDSSCLRPNLLFSLLKVLSHNINRSIDSVNIFELAKIYSYKENLPKEADVLGILVYGEFYSDWLRNQRLIYSFFDLKGIVETILRDLGIKDYQFKRNQIPYLAEGATFGLKDKDFGFLGEVERDTLERFEVRKRFGVYFAQIYLEDLEPFVSLEKEFKSLPLFPSVRRDISLVVKKGITCEEILKVIYESGRNLLSSVTLFDQYEGKPIPEDSIGLSFSLEYRSKEKTLTAEEVDSQQKIILEDLQKKLGVKIR